ncbi:cell division protein ZapA [Hahella sp. CCB-MM4]|uniref:cell division protein ZapA n=1 Tax=Hahella sp. (strain CCB-MM4) TaxID=1926491 RepID=UPI000B9BE3CA|nr:cell division protein ZapA [Hahella sp. CCB-MM4]OZG74906.1 cell division protein ZapA [Hahella sp. CCB-MM4]
MSTTPNTVSVNILEKEYLVACPPEARAQLEQAARVLDNKMKEIRSSGKVYGTERIAVMAALNLTHDLLQEGEKSTKFDTTLESLQSKIDTALKSLS